MFSTSGTTSSPLLRNPQQVSIEDVIPAERLKEIKSEERDEAAL